MRIVVFSRPSIETAAPYSLQAARGRMWSGPLDHKWQPDLRILSGLCTRLFIHVWGAGGGSPHIEVEAGVWGGEKRAGWGFFCFVFSRTAVSANSFWSHLSVFVRPQAVATLVDNRILNSQSASLENESQKEDKGWRSVKTGDESPSWQRNRPCPVWSGPCQMVPQMNVEKKKNFWK